MLGGNFGLVPFFDGGNRYEQRSAATSGTGATPLDSASAIIRASDRSASISEFRSTGKRAMGRLLSSVSLGQAF